MAATSTTIFSHQGLSNEQLLDATDRITTVLLDRQTGVPPADATTREVVSDAAAGVRNLAARLRLERKSRFTADRARFQKQRDDAVSAIRRGVKSILTDPDPNLPEEKRAGADVLRSLLAKRPNAFERKSHAENSGELKLLFADLETPEGQAALNITDLMRFYHLLKEGQTGYATLLQAEEQTVPPSKTLPDLRTIKKQLAEDIRLVLQVLHYFAAKGRQPYATLLDQCNAILAEVDGVAKGRDSRARRVVQAQAGGRDPGLTVAAEVTRPPGGAAAPPYVGGYTPLRSRGGAARLRLLTLAATLSA